MFIRILLISLIILFFIKSVSSEDAIIYSDFISTDENKNIEAKGNVKIINGEQILSTEKVFIDEENDKIILEEKFTFKDEMGNFYFGSEG